MNTLKLEVRVSSPVEIPTVSFKAKLISSKDKEVKSLPAKGRAK